MAGTANRVADDRLRSFTIAVPGWDSDEGPTAARLADPLGLDHRSEAMEPPGPDEVADLVAALHEPLNDLSLLPTLAVSRFARREVTVALSGDGGDELFFGYARPWAADAHRLLWRLPQRARRVPVGVLSRTGRLRYRAVLHEDPAAYYRAMHRSAELEALAEVAPGLADLAPDPVDGPTGLDRRAVAELGRAADVDIQLNRVLTKVDMASMHHSLEVRVPLLDPDVIATALRIDPAWTLDQPRSKPVLRTLLDRMVPPGTVPDTKLGFTVPLADWLDGPLAPLVEDTLLGGDLWPAGLLDPAGGAPGLGSPPGGRPADDPAVGTAVPAVVGHQNGRCEGTEGRIVLTRYEVARVLASPAFPAFDARVRRDLRQLARQSPARHPEVLDVGARTSPFTAGVPVRVTVLDLPRERDVQHALKLGVTDDIVRQLRQRRSNIERVVLEDMTRCSEPDGRYDGVLAVEVIEHVADDEAFVAQLRRVVRPGGWAYLTTPNGDYVRNEGEDHNPDHLRLYGRDDLRDLLDRHFDAVDVVYGIHTGTHRWHGQRLSVAKNPVTVAHAVWSNLANRLESRHVDDQARRTANLFAVCRVASP